jgi:hypothetical protein
MAKATIELLGGHLDGTEVADELDRLSLLQKGRRPLVRRRRERPDRVREPRPR